MVGRDAIMAVLNEKGGATEAEMLDKTFNPTSIIKGIRLRFTPDASELDNLTSRQFMTRSVSTASQNIVKVEKRTVNGKVKNVQVVQSLADFRTANAPSNSGGGPLPVGGDTEVDPEGD